MTMVARQRSASTTIEGNSPYPEHAAFIDAESPHAGHEITRAFDEGYAVVLVSAGGRERVITAKMLARATDPNASRRMAPLTRRPAPPQACLG